MYLNGDKYRSFKAERKTIDGFPLKSEILELGTWRKHPNLHGFIVNTFNNGVDDCQDITLTVDNLETIIQAIESDALPHTTGPFFGESPRIDGSNPVWGNYQERKKADLAIFKAAKQWVESQPPEIWADCTYRASW